MSLLKKFAVVGLLVLGLSLAWPWMNSVDIKGKLSFTKLGRLTCSLHYVNSNVWHYIGACAVCT